MSICSELFFCEKSHKVDYLSTSVVTNKVKLYMELLYVNNVKLKEFFFGRAIMSDFNLSVGRRQAHAE